MRLSKRLTFAIGLGWGGGVIMLCIIGMFAVIPKKALMTAEFVRYDSRNSNNVAIMRFANRGKSEITYYVKDRWWVLNVNGAFTKSGNSIQRGAAQEVQLISFNCSPLQAELECTARLTETQLKIQRTLRHVPGMGKLFVPKKFTLAIEIPPRTMTNAGVNQNFSKSQQRRE